MNLITLIGWIGAAFMVVASFQMGYDTGKFLAIIGLLLLTIQARFNKQMNLVTLNIFSIIGFTYALHF